MAILSVVMAALSALVALPFYYIVVNTFKTQSETTDSPFALPKHWTWSNYSAAFSGQPIAHAFLNTLYVTIVSVGLMLLVGALASYGRIIGHDRVSAVIGTVVLAAFVVPGQATLIPLYRMLVHARLVDSVNGLVVMYACGSIFCYFLILGYMRTVPLEILEAARIDGAGAFRVFRSIVLPLIRPILVTVGVFQTMWVWNDFITPNVLIQSESQRTLVLLVYSAVGEFTTDWPAFMTLTVIALVPMVIFFIVMQRHIVSGLVQGSVKG